MATDFILINTAHGGVATVTLNRPEVHNAFDDKLVGELAAALNRLAADDTVRTVILAASGESFSAGADLAWMQRTAQATEEQNREDAAGLATLLRTLYRFPKPTIARVQGAAFGGGVGLVACADIAIAAETARFSFSEVRLGLIPSAISPYVLRAIGPRQAQRYFLTAERFTASEAHRIGLVHEVTPASELDTAVGRMATALRQGGPAALAAAKNLIADFAAPTLDDALVRETAARIAAVRMSGEGREGMRAFLEHRHPHWQTSEGPV
jgi:methylglutaconyl-CoA hydratase